MALQTTNRKTIRIGDGTTVTYPVPFPFLDNTHLKVYLVDLTDDTKTLQAITTNYTVSGDGSLGQASVIFVSAPTSDSKVVIYRETPITQTEELFDRATQTATTVESAIDKLTMILQELSEEAGRAQVQDVTVTTPVASPSASEVLTDMFMGYITSTPTGVDHPFEERQPVASANTNQTLAGGRTGSLRFVNGCTDDKTGEYVFVMQMRDTAGTTVYRSWIPGT